MSATLTAPSRVIYRTSVTYCILPADLGRHLAQLERYYEGAESIEFLVERRGAGDRRVSAEVAPHGIDRRVADRRTDPETRTAAEIGMELPRSLRRHAGRIVCTWRAVPVHLGDADREADALLAAAAVDGAARDELRLRYHHRVYGTVVMHTFTRRRALELTDRVFEELFAHHGADRFSRELARATARVLAGD